MQLRRHINTNLELLKLANDIDKLAAGFRERPVTVVMVTDRSVTFKGQGQRALVAGMQVPLSMVPGNPKVNDDYLADWVSGSNGG